MPFALILSPEPASHERVSPPLAPKQSQLQLRALSLLGDDIQRRAQQQLHSSPYREVRHTTCAYSKGLLLLKGQVSSFYLKQIAQTVVRDVVGVRHIVNTIQVHSAGERSATTDH
jgi:osmotically-inducible protein OsmY